MSVQMTEKKHHYSDDDEKYGKQMGGNITDVTCSAYNNFVQ